MIDVIRLPIFCTISMASLFQAPDVSIAIGTNYYYYYFLAPTSTKPYYYHYYYFFFCVYYYYKSNCNVKYAKQITDIILNTLFVRVFIICKCQKYQKKSKL